MTPTQNAILVFSAIKQASLMEQLKAFATAHPEALMGAGIGAGVGGIGAALGGAGGAGAALSALGGAGAGGLLGEYLKKGPAAVKGDPPSIVADMLRSDPAFAAPKSKSMVLDAPQDRVTLKQPEPANIAFEMLRSDPAFVARKQMVLDAPHSPGTPSLKSQLRAERRAEQYDQRGSGRNSD